MRWCIPLAQVILVALLGALVDPFARGKTWTLYLGDSLDVLSTVGLEATVCVTDPPFGINTKSDGAGKLDPTADMLNAARWYAEWFKHVRRIVGPAGCMWSCLNWRSFAVFEIASNRASWPIESMLVWDKDWIGPGGSRGLRPSYELVGLWCGENFGLRDRGIADQLTVPWCAVKPTGHPAEKPVDLFAKLLEWSVEGRDRPAVLDPFAGSGRSGVAALRAGLTWTGVELNEPWAEFIARSLEQEERNGKQTDLFGARA